MENPVTRRPDGTDKTQRVPTDRAAVTGTELAQIARASILGPVNLNQTAEVAIVIRDDPNNNALDSIVHGTGSKRVSKRLYVTRDMIARNHSASPADLDAVAAFANNYGLAVSQTSPGSHLVKVVGTLGNLAQAFNVKLANYRSPQGVYLGYSGAISVPSELSDVIVGVFGLDTKPQSTYLLKKPALNAAAAAAASAYTPSQVGSLYNFPAGLNGQGQCIGIIEFGGGYRMSDLTTYFQQQGLAPPNIVAVSVEGATNSPSNPNSPDMEVMLDIEVVASIAPAAQIVVYFAPNTTLGWWAAINTAINDSYYNPSVISISWGGPESSWSAQAMQAINNEFQTAAAVGITVCVAAGDSGSSDGVPMTNGTQTANVNFPASSPYVLACGGTSVRSSNGSITSEVVWNDGPNKANPTSATGGGVSSFFPLPDWQNGAGVPLAVNPPTLPGGLPPNTPGRGMPDVCGDADPDTGYRIVVDGTNQIVGGTSAVAPLWAGLIALINQKLGNSSGFLNPLLYRLYNPSTPTGGFNDIQTGSNGAYSAGPGWDPCTGLGSPNGAVLSNIV